LAHPRGLGDGGGVPALGLAVLSLPAVAGSRGGRAGGGGGRARARVLRPRHPLGAIFSKGMWGAYWNWDPRQTSIFFLLLVYAAYLTLRGAVDDPARRARLAAVYGLFAAAVTPLLVFVVPRIFFSLHPDPIVNTSGKLEMNGRM